MRMLLGLLLLSGMTLGSVCGQSADTATVHFYRYRSGTAKMSKPPVYCDGIQLAKIRNGSVYTAQIPAGTHTFYSEYKPAGMRIRLEAGKEYYFRTDIDQSLGFWMVHFRLTEVEPDQGAFEIRSLKPLATKTSAIR